MALGAYLSLRPGILKEPIFPHLDKLIHAAGYGLLAMFACGLFEPGRPRRWSLLWLLMFSAWIEWAQGAWAVNRQADLWDLLANAAGIASGALLFRRFNGLLLLERLLSAVHTSRGDQ